MNYEISHEDFVAIINEEKNYPELKESIRMMKSQRSNAEKNNLIEEKALTKLLDKMHKSI